MMPLRVLTLLPLPITMTMVGKVLRGKMKGIIIKLITGVFLCQAQGPVYLCACTYTLQRRVSGIGTFENPGDLWKCLDEENRIFAL